MFVDSSSKMLHKNAFQNKETCEGRKKECSTVSTGEQTKSMTCGFLKKCFVLGPPHIHPQIHGMSSIFIIHFKKVFESWFKFVGLTVFFVFVFCVCACVCVCFQVSYIFLKAYVPYQIK